LVPSWNTHAGIGHGSRRTITELIRRAEAGDDVILTRHGNAVVRLVPIRPAPDRKSRRALLEAVRASAAGKAKAGPDAARSQDFLYGDNGKDFEPTDFEDAL
jgi:prevent-host-death family protein